jgi:hypothetical protein
MRPRKPIPVEQRKVITIEQLVKEYDAISGIKSPRSVPIERQQQFLIYCQRNPQFWHQNKNLRIAMLDKIGKLETHVIDFYQDNKQPAIQF